MEESNVAFAKYLQAYTAASVQLLRRWPTFVPDEERFADVLEPGTAAAKRVFDIPDTGAEAELAQGLKVVGHAKPRAITGGSPRSSRPSSQPETPSGGARASGTPRAGGGGVSGGGGGGGGGDGGSSVREEKLKDKIEQLQGKLRHEVSERSKANDESMRRGMQLQAIQRDNAALQETVRRQAQQLEHAREVTLKMEQQHREFMEQVESADARLVKERKLRYTWQLRAEKLQKKIDPLEAEAVVLKEALSTTVELYDKARDKNAANAAQVSELSDSNRRLADVQQRATKQAALAREARDNNVLQLELMADRRDELLEQIEKLNAEAAEHQEALEAMEKARNEAADLAQEERRLRNLAEAAVRKAAQATDAAADEKKSWMDRAVSLGKDLEQQKEHVSALVTQDAIRETEQRKLFDSVSELLARVQYLGELPPETLGMSKAEALQHRDEAMRHLKALREAHALSTFPPQLVLNPATVATGAAMLNAQRGQGGAASPRRAGGAAVTGAGGGEEARATPNEEARSALSPRVRAQAAVQGGYTQPAPPSLDASRARPPRPNLAGSGAKAGGGAKAAAAAAVPSIDVSKAQQQQQQQQQQPAGGGGGYESWRSSVEFGGSGLSPRSARPGASPRGGPTSGRRAGKQDPARNAPPNKDEPASEWEKQRLLELMRS